MTHPVRYLPGEMLLALHRRRGPMVDAGLGRRGYVYLFGAEANKFVFANSDAFNWWEAFQVLVPVDGPTALIVSDGADHRRRRSLVQPAFHQRHLAHYLQPMAANADAVIDTWRPGTPSTSLPSCARRSGAAPSNPYSDRVGLRDRRTDGDAGPAAGQNPAEPL